MNLLNLLFLLHLSNILRLTDNLINKFLDQNICSQVKFECLTIRATVAPDSKGHNLT